LYSLRLVRMVFAGERRGPEPAHDGLPAMRVSLAILAIGTLTSWLLAGQLGRMFSATLPALHLESDSTGTLVRQIVVNPATWITLAVIGLGFSLWVGRKYFARPARALKPLAESGLGFDWLNRQIVSLTQRVAGFLQRFQTGQLNWNIAGILGGLIVILLLLAGVR
jgi:NADH-quinone oxidoreductase subunit L